MLLETNFGSPYQPGNVIVGRVNGTQVYFGRPATKYDQRIAINRLNEKSDEQPDGMF